MNNLFRAVGAGRVGSCPAANNDGKKVQKAVMEVDEAETKMLATQIRDCGAEGPPFSNSSGGGAERARLWSASAKIPPE